MSEPTADLADQPPRKIAPNPRLSGWGLTFGLLAACLIPLAGLSLYATFYGRAASRSLPVEVTLDRQTVVAPNGQGGMLVDVVVVRNLADHEIPNLTVNLNGQYFLYRDSPLQKGETLVLPQAIFMTKANQRFTPGRYPILEVTVTGRLPSNARGVKETHFE
ncbi:hypothetical protein Pla52o_08120 [Novipirellula galeiformis]|uniref:Uncharacterized protein n=1 Tax=Novipirellula galeiformis TaxID=2528004 RepID=A0A5C6CVF8_9BACT|nr:hypothetical protein [Novipirellula galeiformis]TWU26956.1 hypothetical protein Pla52o_08120 [Novipirellula galeiformis]